MTPIALASFVSEQVGLCPILQNTSHFLWVLHVTAVSHSSFVIYTMVLIRDPKQGSGRHCAVQTNNKDSVYPKELGVSQDPRDGHNGPKGWRWVGKGVTKRMEFSGEKNHSSPSTIYLVVFRCPDTEEMQRCGCSDALKSCSTVHPSRAWKAHILLDKARQKFKEYFDPHKNDA